MPENAEGQPPVGYATSSRGCTDILFVILLLAVWVGLCVVAGVAYSNGSIWRLLRANDFEGNPCGVTSSTQPSVAELTYAGGGNNWGDRPNIWYPLMPSMALVSSSLTNPLSITNPLSQIMKLGICVKDCPQFSIQYNASWGSLSLPALSPTSYVTAYDSHLVYPVYYTSSPVYFRCIPTFNNQGDATTGGGSTYNTEIKSLADKLASELTVTQFVQRGISELGGVWKVFVICMFLVVIFSMLYIFALRWITMPMVILSLLSVLGLLCALGALFYVQGVSLEKTAEKYARAYKIAAYCTWALAAIYLFLLIWFFRRIRLAIQVIKLSSRVMASAWTVMLLPLLCDAVLVYVAGFCLLIALYLESSGSFQTVWVPFNITSGAITQAGSVASKVFNRKDSFEYLMIYDLFAFLWTMGFINALCFMTLAFVSVFWYFSTPGDNKSLPLFPVTKALWWTVRYHMGTVAFGSFIVAVIQTIRFLLSMVERRLRALSGTNPTACLARFVLCCVQCCLRCWERIVAVISRNAYIVTCIKGTGFCRSGVTAVRLIIANLLDMGSINFIADAVMAISTIMLVLLSMFCCWLIMRYTSLGPPNSLLAIPILAVGIGSYFVVRLFMNVFNAIQDAILLCYCYDKCENDGSPERPYYLTSELMELIGKFNQKRQTPPHSPETHPTVNPNPDSVTYDPTSVTPAPTPAGSLN